jgi:uncharacterized protein (TIGR00251 family)
LIPFTVDAEGVTLAVRLTPRAAKKAVGGVIALPDERFALAVRITTPPIEGAANTALIALLAKALGLRKFDVSIRSGETGRLKIVRLAGDGPAIAARLEALIGA